MGGWPYKFGEDMNLTNRFVRSDTAFNDDVPAIGSRFRWRDIFPPRTETGIRANLQHRQGRPDPQTKYRWVVSPVDGAEAHRWGDLMEIGQRVVSGSGGRGDIARMQQIYLRYFFDEPAIMGLMGVTHSQLDHHATRRLDLKWKQLWHRDRRVRLGPFVRMRAMPAVGGVEEGIMPEAAVDPIVDIEVADASDHDLGLNEAESPETAVTAARTLECPALVQGMLRGEVDDEGRVVRRFAHAFTACGRDPSGGAVVAVPAGAGRRCPASTRPQAGAAEAQPRPGRRWEGGEEAEGVAGDAGGIDSRR